MFRRVIVMLLLTMFLVNCQGTRLKTTPTPQLINLHITATATMVPLAQDLIRTYVRSDVLFVISLEENNWRGIQGQIEANPNLYGLTTYLPDESGLWAAPLGEDGIAIISDPDLTIPVLTASQLRGIFTGAFTNWEEVGGADVPIIVVSAEPDSDTHLAFKRLVLGDRQITFAARLAPSSSMMDVVATTPGAIGYVSYGLVDRRVRVIPVAATADEPPQTPSIASIANQTYPLRTPILLVGQHAPPPNSPIYQFFIWMQQGSGQQIIGRDYVPLQAD